MKLRTNDNVIMLSGKDRGKKGKIIRVEPAEGKVLVEGLNLVKKHLRARAQGQTGQVISKERMIPASSVALICKSCGKPTRIGFKIEGDPASPAGRQKVRICRKCQVPIT